MRRVVFPQLVLAAACHYDLTSPDDTDTVPSIWTPPPENSWEQTTPPAGLVAEGFEVGDVVPDVRLMDQHEDLVSLWQFWGKVIVLDISTIWCAPCQALAETTQETYDDYADQGFMYVTVLQEDLHNEDPETDDLMLWVNEYGLNTPVLDDGTKEETGDAIVPANTWPAVLVIDRDMVVHERVEAEDSALRAAIEEVL
jgi:thiol-disulfide isomerase/thioredoxin